MPEKRRLAQNENPWALLSAARFAETQQFAIPLPASTASLLNDLVTLPLAFALVIFPIFAIPTVVYPPHVPAHLKGESRRSPNKLTFFRITKPPLYF
jgi:hypothetical protein